MEQPQPDHRVLTSLARFWRGRDIGIVYGVIVIVVSLWIGLHSDATVRKLVESVSTNLDNMRANPVAVLVASAFVVSPLTQLLLVPVVVFVFGLVQRWLGRTALVAVWVFGHVGATLFVMAMEINALYRHIAHFSIVVKPDVGVSYGMAAAIALLCARVPQKWRLPYALGCLAVTVGDVRDLAGLHLLGPPRPRSSSVSAWRRRCTAARWPPRAPGTSVVSEDARSLSA